MFETIKNALRKPEKSNFVVVTSGGDYGKLPEGFFTSLAGDQSQVGFFCPKCKLVLRHGAHNGVTHCGVHQMPPPADAGPLPQVRWEYANMPGTNGVVANVGGNRVVDTDSAPGTFSGDVVYDGDHPCGKIKDYDLGNTALDSGLWGGGR